MVRQRMACVMSADAVINSNKLYDKALLFVSTDFGREKEEQEMDRY